jgi:hypothetical protein
MSTSPLGPEDIRAAAEVHRELPPEYDDAVVAAFIERVDRAVTARVEARLAASRRQTRSVKTRDARALVKGIAIGACAGAVAVAGIGLGVVRGVAEVSHSAPAPVIVHAPNAHFLPFWLRGNGPIVRRAQPPPAQPKP